MQKITPPFALGETLKGTDADGNLINSHWEGAIFEIQDKATATSVARRSGRGRLVMIVRNKAGITLLPKRGVLLKTDGGADYFGRVNGYNTTLGQSHVAGIVDDLLPSTGCASNDLCFITVKGPCIALTPNAGAEFNGADIAAGNKLVACTAAGSTTSAGGRLTNVTLVGQTGTTAAFDFATNLVAVALSARTTGETGADLLVHVIANNAI